MYVSTSTRNCYWVLITLVAFRVSCSWPSCWIWECGGGVVLCCRVAALNMIAESFCPVRWISVVLWCSVLATHHVWPISRTSAQLVPATFCFGDSLADPGNNNYINTLSKANYPFNGIDFAAGPTGRFTNGRTTVDIIGTVLLLAALCLGIWMEVNFHKNQFIFFISWSSPVVHSSAELK